MCPINQLCTAPHADQLLNVQYRTPVLQEKASADGLLVCCPAACNLGCAIWVTCSLRVSPMVNCDIAWSPAAAGSIAGYSSTEHHPSLSATPPVTVWRKETILRPLAFICKSCMAILVHSKAPAGQPSRFKFRKAVLAAGPAVDRESAWYRLNKLQQHS